MFSKLILGTVLTLVWFSNISITNGRLFEWFCSLAGIGFFGLVFVGMQMNKPQPEFRGFDGYEQERIGFAIAASQMLPEYRKDLIRDADAIVKSMERYNIVLNKKYVKEVMEYHLKNTPDYYWDEFARRAGSRKVYAH